MRLGHSRPPVHFQLAKKILSDRIDFHSKINLVWFQTSILKAYRFSTTLWIIQSPQQGTLMPVQHLLSNIYIQGFLCEALDGCDYWMCWKKDSLLPGFYFQLFRISMQGAYMPCCKWLVFLYDVSFFFLILLMGFLLKLTFQQHFHY